MDVLITRPLRGAAIAIAVTSTLAGLPAHLLANSDPAKQDWSTDPADPGWSKQAYSPDKVAPEYGDGFNADGSPKGGENANKPYDSYNDPHHPLKNPKGPPKEWVTKDVPVDKDGDGKQDKDENGKPVTKNVPVFPADGSPPVQRSSADIDWGEKYFDGQFDQPLAITNKCNAPRPVTITIKDLSYLTLPSSVMVGAGERKVIMGKVKLPPEPPPPTRLGLPGEPGWGWVDFSSLLSGQPFPPPKVHQPNFGQVNGRVEVWHPWAPASAGSQGDCFPKLSTYTITGHVHFRPPAPPKEDEGPSQLAKTDVCELYWKLGVPPEQLKDKDCTREIRALADSFLKRVVPPYVQNAPDDWLWLSAVDVQSMSIDELLNMKARADSVMGW